MRRLGLILVSLLILPACGEASFGTLGHRSGEWIEEARKGSPTTSTTLPGILLVGVDKVAWWNEEIGSLEPGPTEQAIASVYDRRTPSDRFVQASPREVARAVPGIAFPSLVPPEVRSITSQLHFAPRSDRLDDEFVAAFGLWTVEPYTRSRSVGQAAVLTVGLDEEQAAEAAGGALGCGAFDATSVFGCASLEVGDRPVFELVGELGNTFVWFDEALRYELFLRDGIDGTDLAVAMIRSVEPLEVIAFGELPEISPEG